MENKTISKILQPLKKIAVGLLICNISLLNAQQKQDSLYKSLELLVITKTNFRTQPKKDISTQQTDFLNHDAGRFLTQLPEMSGVRKSGSYATDPVLRGFKNEQLNVVMDGMMNAINACPNRMDPAISQINMNVVKQAEIYKGPYHFRHGTALGGTINFITVPPSFTDKKQINGRFSTGYESNGNVLRNEGIISLLNKSVVLDVFGAYQKSENYKDGNRDEIRTKFTRYNVGAKLNLKWNPNHFSSFQLNSNQGRDTDFPALAMNLIYDKTWMFQLKHISNFKNSILKSVEANSYLTLVDHSMGTQDLSMISDVASKTYGARAEVKFGWKNNILFTGLDYKYEAANNLRFVMPKTMPARDGTA